MLNIQVILPEWSIAFPCRVKSGGITPNSYEMKETSLFYVYLLTVSKQ